MLPCGERKLSCLLNMGTLDDLPSFSAGPKEPNLNRVFPAIKQAGYDGVQFVKFPDAASLQLCREFGFLAAGFGRVNTPNEIRALAERFAGSGLFGATLHVGWGLEDDNEAHTLIESILECSARTKFPLWPEIHRATIFQDCWRTVKFAERYPTLQFNGDFSHWYTGLEMVYGGFERKFAFISPVVERVRFLHGRIGNPGCIQVALSDREEDNQPYQQHFAALWTAAMTAFLRQSSPGDILPFTAELLSPRIFYGRAMRCGPGEPQEESDRWLQALRLCEIARECWLAACSEGASV